MRMQQQNFQTAVIETVVESGQACVEEHDPCPAGCVLFLTRRSAGRG